MSVALDVCMFSSNNSERSRQTTAWQSIRRSLPTDAQRTLAAAFIASQVDYCNSVLYGTSSHHAGSSRCASLGPSATANTVQNQIYAFNCVREHCPAYFNNVCIPVAGISGRANLRSASSVPTCLSLRQEHSSADGVSMLQPKPSGTCFHRSSAHHLLVVDSLELG